jgi:hypothetical protein
MDVYEIRIKNQDQRHGQIYSSSHIGDHAAIRRAWALAAIGGQIEVWKGAECVYIGTKEFELES